MAIYEELKMEVIVFESEDIITTSCPYEDPNAVVLPFVPAGEL